MPEKIRASTASRRSRVPLKTWFFQASSFQLPNFGNLLRGSFFTFIFSCVGALISFFKKFKFFLIPETAFHNLFQTSQEFNYPVVSKCSFKTFGETRKRWNQFIDHTKPLYVSNGSANQIAEFALVFKHNSTNHRYYQYARRVTNCSLQYPPFWGQNGKCARWKCSCCPDSWSMRSRG